MDTFNFEQAFSRLESILEKMHSGNVSLDDSLNLYEEADTLIVSCIGRLNEAEERIEKLIKKRNGELSLGKDGEPLTESFEPRE